MNNQKEVWKDVPNYEGIYQVSSLGRVKSLKRKSVGKHVRIVNERILKPATTRKGYLIVVLYNNAKPKTISVHQLVAIAFLSHTQCGMCLIIDHINNIKTDNRVDNLQRVTNRLNSTKDRFRIDNTSKFPGVCWDKNRGKWRSGISAKGRTEHLGRFNCEIEASKAYQAALKRINQGLHPKKDIK